MVSDSDVFCQALAEPERLRRCERSERLASIDRVWAARAGTRVSALGPARGQGRDGLRLNSLCYKLGKLRSCAWPREASCLSLSWPSYSNGSYLNTLLTEDIKPGKPM